MKINMQLSKCVALIIFFGAMFFTACSVETEKETKRIDPNSDSWYLFCIHYGIDPENPTEEDENSYLDGYVGSALEEADLRDFRKVEYGFEEVTITK